MAWWNAIATWLRGAETQPAGTEETPGVARAADWNDVLRVVALLDKHGAEYALVGGYALNLHGIIRQTGDVDILVRDTPENNRRWIAAMCELPDGAARELLDTPDNPFRSDEPLDDDEDDHGVIRIADEFVVDILPKVCGLTFEDLEGRMRVIQTPYGRVRTLDLAGLEMTKRGVRPKDIADRRLLSAALRDGRSPQSKRSVTQRYLGGEPTRTVPGYTFADPPQVAYETDDEVTVGEDQTPPAPKPR